LFIREDRRRNWKTEEVTEKKTLRHCSFASLPARTRTVRSGGREKTNPASKKVFSVSLFLHALCVKYKNQTS